VGDVQHARGPVWWTKEVITNIVQMRRMRVVEGKAMERKKLRAQFAFPRQDVEQPTSMGVFSRCNELTTSMEHIPARKLRVAQLDKKFPPFMELEVSLRCSQEPTNDLCP
jgi:hypothetical protein